MFKKADEETTWWKCENKGMDLDASLSGRHFSPLSPMAEKPFRDGCVPLPSRSKRALGLVCARLCIPARADRKDDSCMVTDTVQSCQCSPGETHALMRRH